LEVAVAAGRGVISHGIHFLYTLLNRDCLSFLTITEKMSAKLKRFTETILRHKKKSIFAFIVAITGGNALNSKIKDDELRRFYGEKSKQYGSIPIHPNQKLRKVVVLINNEAKRRSAARLFNKNGLPLLNLAGLDVNVINVSSQSEMEKITKTINYQEADCIFLVGGDGTLCHALNGIFQKTNINEQQPFPIGLFPGGNRNKSFSILEFIKKSIHRVRCVFVVKVQWH
jgi:hypothetical protein